MGFLALLVTSDDPYPSENLDIISTLPHPDLSAFCPFSPGRSSWVSALPRIGVQGMRVVNTVLSPSSESISFLSSRHHRSVPGMARYPPAVPDGPRARSLRYPAANPLASVNPEVHASHSFAFTLLTLSEKCTFTRHHHQSKGRSFVSFP